MTRLLVTLLPYIIVGLYVVGLIFFLLSLQQLRRGRTGQYWRLRRAAGQRGGQLFLLAIALFGVASALALFSGLADLAYKRLTGTLVDDPNVPKGVVLPTLTPPVRFTSTPTLTATTKVAPSQTLTPIPPSETIVASVTASATSTSTVTTMPTNTSVPTATFESVLALTPQASEKQPRTGAKVEITTAALGISPEQSPVEPSTQFDGGVQRIYFFFIYQAMDDGIGWSRILFRDGVPVQGQSYLWSLGEAGSSYFFFGAEEGYPAGEYEAQLFLGDQVVSTFSFTIAAISP